MLPAVDANGVVIDEPAPAEQPAAVVQPPSHQPIPGQGQAGGVGGEAPAETDDPLRMVARENAKLPYVDALGRPTGYRRDGSPMGPTAA